MDNWYRTMTLEELQMLAQMQGDPERGLVINEIKKRKRVTSRTNRWLEGKPVKVVYIITKSVPYIKRVDPSWRYQSLLHTHIRTGRQGLDWGDLL